MIVRFESILAMLPPAIAEAKGLEAGRIPVPDYRTGVESESGTGAGTETEAEPGVEPEVEPEVEVPEGAGQ